MLASLAMQWPALVYRDAVVRYHTKSDAIPTADQLLKQAVAQIGGFLAVYLIKSL